MFSNEHSRPLVPIQANHLMRAQKIALIVLTATIFGCLMAVRDMFDNIWLRAIIAGIAFGGLVPTAGWLLRRQVED